MNAGVRPVGGFQTSTGAALPTPGGAGAQQHVLAPDALVAKLLSCPPGRLRTRALVDELRDVAGEILGVDGAGLDPSSPLTSLGMDSAGMLRLRDRVEQLTGTPVPATMGWRAPTLDAMAPEVARMLGVSLEATSRPQQTATLPGRPEPAPDEVLDLDDDIALILAELEGAQDNLR